MSDIKLFQFSDNSVLQIEGKSVAIEKSLQTQIEKNLETLLGVRFLASEYKTGKYHAGRIDTIGIDENGCPVIIEYKRTLSENVINQGLYYLDWLMEAKADFTLLVQKKFGVQEAEDIDWSGSRLLCIAGDFSKFDEHAIKQINRNIELIRYKRFGEKLLLLELINAVQGEIEFDGPSGPKPKSTEATITEKFEKSSPQIQDLYESLKAFLLVLGDDVQVKTQKFYFAFKRIKNFACVEIHPSMNKIVVFTKSDLNKIHLEDGFTRDVSKIGHYGTGNLEITIYDEQDLERAKPLILLSYEDN